jgi:chromosome condensin MukBEF MukE localization factor
VRRLFWLVMGVTIGALVVRKLSKAAERLTPRGMADGLGAGLSELAEALRDFGDDVRSAMREREAELRAGTGLDGDLGDRPAPATE